MSRGNACGPVELTGFEAAYKIFFASLSTNSQETYTRARKRHKTVSVSSLSLNEVTGSSSVERQLRPGRRFALSRHGFS